MTNGQLGLSHTPLERGDEHPGSCHARHVAKCRDVVQEMLDYLEAHDKVELLSQHVVLSVEQGKACSGYTALCQRKGL
jgi:hypothetical protein